MASGERYIVITVECQHCKTKQKVHVGTRTGVGQIGDQTIQCIRCNNHFKVTAPHKIMGGPFPV